MYGFKKRKMPDGKPLRQKIYRRWDDNESPNDGQPFLNVFHTMSVALLRLFMICNCRLFVMLYLDLNKALRPVI